MPRFVLHEGSHPCCHKPTSPQAYIWFAVLLSLISIASGCGSPVGLSADAAPASPDSRIESLKAPISFDAGVVFADEASYICIPLEKLGIDVGKEIASIKSSCECVRPSVVRYLRRKSEEGVAIRLDFVEESNAQDEINPVLLGVAITVTFVSGDEQLVSILFLHTSPLASVL